MWLSVIYTHERYEGGRLELRILYSFYFFFPRCTDLGLFWIEKLLGDTDFHYLLVPMTLC